MALTPLGNMHRKGRKHQGLDSPLLASLGVDSTVPAKARFSTTIRMPEPTNVVADLAPGFSVRVENRPMAVSDACCVQCE